MTFPLAITGLMFVPVFLGSLYLIWLASRSAGHFSWLCFMGGGFAAIQSSIIIAMKLREVLRGQNVNGQGMLWVVHDNAQAGFMIISILAGIIVMRRITKVRKTHGLDK